jgi:Protein of unknown function (DUF2934)
MTRNKLEALIDEAVEETFPASDPPSYMAGAIPGSPPRYDERSEQDETRTRERAYFLWESEGRPEGCAEEHWRVAQLSEQESRST